MFFLNNPDVDFNLIGLADVFDMPGLRCVCVCVGGDSLIVAGVYVCVCVCIDWTGVVIVVAQVCR